MTYVRSTVVGVASSDPRRYMTIAADLREQISNGRLAPGQAIPSITVLCRQWGRPNLKLLVSGLVWAS
jgi:Bacterial regulatory proteins, gntR family